MKKVVICIGFVDLSEMETSMRKLAHEIGETMGKTVYLLKRWGFTIQNIYKIFS